MSVQEFFQYLLGRETARELGLQLAGVYNGRILGPIANEPRAGRAAR